jgi:1-acyl-sn-glycerol-3-phosphate acyltransferase
MGAWTAFCYLAWLPVAILALVSGNLSRRWNEFIVRVWTGGLVAALGMKVEVVGTPPPKPFFMVANHLSYLDILVLGSRLGPTFISKHELVVALPGAPGRVTGVIFVNWDRKRYGAGARRDRQRGGSRRRVALSPRALAPGATRSTRSRPRSSSGPRGISTRCTP